MFQVLAAGKPFVTRASPAVEQLANTYPDTVLTVPAADPQALADAVRRALAGPERLKPLPRSEMAKLGPQRGISEMLDRLSAG